jgi:hypothetical protein
VQIRDFLVFEEHAHGRMARAQLRATGRAAGSARADADPADLV